MSKTTRVTLNEIKHALEQYLGVGIEDVVPLFKFTKELDSEVEQVFTGIEVKYDG